MKKLIFILFALSLVSCASKQDILYFQNIENTQLTNIDSIIQQPTIQVDDILYIRLTSLDPKALIPFQFDKPGTSSSLSVNSNNIALLKLKGYLVDKDGDIVFPQLGAIHVLGKTTNQIEKLLKRKIAPYVSSLTVSVRRINYKVTVLGEVKSPGTFPISDAQITLPQVLGMAGDLTIHGQRHNILIIRTQGDQRVYKHIDLTKSDWMNSPFYYLRQNDVVYVPPNNPKVKTAGYIGTVGNILSVASILLSAAVIIFR